MKIYVVDKEIKVYFSSRDKEDEAILAFSLPSIYDCDKFTIVISDGHDMLESINIEDISAFTEMTYIEGKDKNTYTFIRR